MAKLLTGTRIYGTGTVDTQLFVSGSNVASSTLTGALVVTGGAGIGGDLRVGGTIFGTISGAGSATTATQVSTVAQTGNASYFPAFVDSNNASSTGELVYTTSSFSINPSTGNVSIGASSLPAKLEVAGDITAYSTTALPTILINSSQAAGYKPALVQLFRIGAGGAVTPDNQTIGTIRFDGLSVGGVYDNAAFITVDSGPNATGGMPTSMSFGTASSGANATERMRIDNVGNVGIGTNSPSYRLDVNGGSLGTTVGNQVITQRLAVTSANVDLLEISNLRTAAGADWTTAGWRLQQKIDATWMGYIQFNGVGNNGGIAFGSGTTTTSPNTISERLRITPNGGMAFGGGGNFGTSGQILRSNGDSPPTWVNPTGTPVAIQEFTATGGQTTFTVTGGYTVGTVQVFANGIQLANSDFTASNGTTVVVVTPRISGDIIRTVTGLAATTINNINALAIAYSVAFGA
jgi:hypothetical protein